MPSPGRKSRSRVGSVSSEHSPSPQRNRSGSQSREFQCSNSVGGQSSVGSKTPGPSRNTSAAKPNKKKSSAKGNKRAGSRNSNRTQDSSMNEGKPSSATSRRVTMKSADISAKGLKSVVMRGQGMTVVPATLLSDKDIGELDLSSNNLRIIPPEIKRLTNLALIDLSKNGLRCLHAQDYSGIPTELSLLPNLEALVISECNLPFVPPAIWKCTNLKVLDISRNKINVLVPEVGNLEKLQHLNAQQTSIATLPPEIAYCQDLEEVLLWGNVIESLPDTLKELPKLSYLAINYRSFCSIVDSYMEGLLRKGQIQSEHIPPVLFEMSNLDILDLEETRINTLPDHCVGKLKEFYLGKNFFCSMPKIVMTLDSLKVLDVSSNMITVIPEEMGNLTNLQILHLNDNNIDKIPPSLGGLTSLKELAVGGNKLNKIPPEIGNMCSLKTLILDRNYIEAIPDTIINLEELETLDLTDNQLSSLPMNFHRMKKITQAHTYRKFHKHGLWLHKNPLASPPQEVWKTDNPEKIFTYLKRLQIMKTENLQRQKILVMGESQCGKSSLIRTLTTGKSALTNGIADSTPGVEFLAWKTDNDVDFLINDFGGGDIFKPVQSILLDPKAIYLIVYDHRKYTPQNHHQAIGRWLEVLAIMVPNAVVKIVGTQTDQCYPDFVGKIREQVEEQMANSQELHEQKMRNEIKKIDEILSNPSKLGNSLAEQLKKQKFQMALLLKSPLKLQPEIALVSSAEGIRGIPDLITEIELLAVNKELFPHAQRYIPEPWGKFRMALKLRKDFCLKWEEVVEIGKKFDLPENMIPNVVHYLYDIGEVLWFHQSPNLKDIVFQRPIGTMEILQGIFRHDFETFLDFEQNRLFASKGQFTKETFQMAKDNFHKYGQLSRPFLLCLWFYLRLDYDDFDFLLDLIPKLDFCYVIPQPDLPARKTEFVPLMVIPTFNQDHLEEDISHLWPEKPLPKQKQLEITLTFPVIYPHGIFERMACRLQDMALSRLDWHDVIYIETEDSKLLLTRALNPETYDSELKISLRGENLANLKTRMGELFCEMRSLISGCPGQVWYVSLNTVNCDKLPLDKCFPAEVLHC